MKNTLDYHLCTWYQAEMFRKIFGISTDYVYLERNMWNTARPNHAE
jgi:hypothetical protein